MTKPINVFILTYCRNPELFYGTSLIFKTLRTGFPNARVRVVDNASLPEARSEIARLAKETECALELLPPPGIAHHEFIERSLNALAAKPELGDKAVFVDPDVCLWRDCEHLEFDALVAGLLLESYNDEVMQCVTMPRLHTSFLWVNHVDRLVQAIETVRRAHFDFDPFRAFSVKLGDLWLRYDTGASLYAALPEECRGFDESHMDYYDHIYAGSHFDLWQGKHPGELRNFMDTVHGLAKAGDLEALKGVWRRQAEVWHQSVSVVRTPADVAGLSHHTVHETPPGRGRPS
jgi:hypothetical protein